jgi:adenylosuccinate synthase
VDAVAVTVVVGGQFGSEGKGKVALAFARRDNAAAVVRVGGPNSGHTAVSAAGSTEVLRQLPTGALLDDALCVLTPGTYIDVPVLLEEIERLSLDPSRLVIDRRAMLVTSDDRRAEEQSDINDRIGSTRSGTGEAVSRRVARRPETKLYLAEQSRYLRPFIADTSKLLRAMLGSGDRVVVEGTQGFGLSVLHSPYYPFSTSRDTTAAGAISEAGLSPRDVDLVVLVLRAFPIRVAGNSGPLPHETDWDTIRVEGGHERELAEYTSVTGRLRRVARFEPEIVRQAIDINHPDEIVLNHLDYVDAHVTPEGYMSQRTRSFLDGVEADIGRAVDYVGLGPDALLNMTRVRHTTRIPA